MDSLKRLDGLLAERGMSLFALSKASGIHYSTLDAARRRKGQLSIDTIERVCAALQIPLYEFFMTDSDWAGIEEYALTKNRHRQGA